MFLRRKNFLCYAPHNFCCRYGIVCCCVTPCLNVAFLARLSTIFIRNEYKKIVCCLIHSPKCFQLYSFFFLPCLQVSYTIVNSNFCLYVNYFLIALLFLIICWSHSRHISIFVFYNLCFSYIFLGIK